MASAPSFVIVWPIMTQQVERLVGYLLDGGADPELSGWLEASSRFRAFAEANRDKIRKKLRGAADAEARRDVRAELRVAERLLADRRFELAFEAYGSGKPGPDFTVRFRETTRFNLEVTRVRRAADAAGLVGPLSAKLRQLPTGVPNVVLVAVDAEEAGVVDVEAGARLLRQRAEAGDDAAGFHERYRRLSGALVFCERGSGEARAAWWANRSARHTLAEPAARACLACLRAG